MNIRKLSTILGAILLSSWAPALALDLLATSYTLTANDPTQSGRLSRNGIPSDWSSTKSFPGITSNGAVHFKTFAINPAGVPFVQVDIDDPGGLFVASAYLDSYNPASPSTNYLGDAGNNGNAGSIAADPAFFQIIVPAGHS